MRQCHGFMNTITKLPFLRVKNIDWHRFANYICFTGDFLRWSIFLVFVGISFTVLNLTWTLLILVLLCVSSSHTRRICISGSPLKPHLFKLLLYSGGCISFIINASSRSLGQENEHCQGRYKSMGAMFWWISSYIKSEKNRIFKINTLHSRISLETPQKVSKRSTRAKSIDIITKINWQCSCTGGF